jgi:macrophage erythroblast attacher
MGDQQGRLELEGPFIRAPVEGLSQVFRSTQKTVVREMGVISHMVEELAAVDPSKPPVSCGDGEEVDRRLEEMIERLEALKVTVQRADAKEAKFACCARERISNLAVPNEYMSDKADTTSSVTALRMWEDRRIDRWVGDFLLQRGHSAVAGAFAASQQLEGLLDSELHERIALAANALRDEGDCRPALEWCEDNAAKLRRRGSTLEFQLRKREFVDMVRKGCRNQALDYAEQYLSPW